MLNHLGGHRLFGVAHPALLIGPGALVGKVFEGDGGGLEEARVVSSDKWMAFHDPKQLAHYFWNCQTNATQYEVPEEFQSASLQ